ncbi:ANTAR domain-containing protein [Pseudonocardia sp. Cha107L01]|uniref:ANTAR domain-containing protein n=1 Tax=Pseudonocardia sp. Cha107L01 TaxID=3457576 RepID=UPI00403EAC97
MQRDRLTTLHAFQLLVRTSQETNVKIVEVARWLITETQTMPVACTASETPTRFPSGDRPGSARPATARTGSPTTRDRGIRVHTIRFQRLGIVPGRAGSRRQLWDGESGHVSATEASRARVLSAVRRGWPEH